MLEDSIGHRGQSTQEADRPCRVPPRQAHVALRLAEIWGTLRSVFHRAFRRFGLGFALPTILVFNAFCICPPTIAQADTAPEHACCAKQAAPGSDRDSTPAKPKPTPCAHCGRAQIGEITPGSLSIARVESVQHLGRVVEHSLSQVAHTACSARPLRVVALPPRADIILTKCSLLL